MKACDIDDLLCMPARMAVIVSLFSLKEMTFTELSDETGLADGNLHVQTRKLQANDYLTKEKAQRGNRMVTIFRISDKGRSQLVSHLNKIWRDLGDESARGAYKKDQNRNKKSEDDSRFW
jgi:DNA-binding PadR family transcriptional regulator